MIERRAIPHEEDETWRRAAQNIKSLRYKPLKNANSPPSLYNNTCSEREIINKRRKTKSLCITTGSLPEQTVFLQHRSVLS